MALPRDRRILVSKLAALLRVADALDRAHASHIRDFHAQRQGDEFVIVVPGATDLTLERYATAQKSEMFADVFGMKVRLEEERVAAPGAIPVAKGP
jgi:exopolyphosphatase/guanosine-5'-triphosphate,3'-diphosphate pyrophosphatase